MPATAIVDESDTKPDGSRYELIAWSIPPSEAYPEGVKYSFQYMTSDGETLLRYDNAPHHDDVARHHRHTFDGELESLEYTSLRNHAEQFLNEVNEIHDRRTD